MKIPKKIRIAGHDITVINNHEFKETDENMGLASVNTNQIFISRTHNDQPIPESERAETFLHEMLHFVEDKWSVKLDEDSHSRLSRGLFQALRDNKLDFSDRS